MHVQVLTEYVKRKTFLARRMSFALPIVGALCAGYGLLTFPNTLQAAPSLTNAQLGSLPTPTATPAETESSLSVAPTLAVSYTVMPGDTLWSIANRFGVTTDALAARNHLAHPDMLQPGEMIIIEGYTTTAIAPPMAPLNDEPKSVPIAVLTGTDHLSETAGLAGLDSTSQRIQLCPNTVLVLPLDLPGDPIHSVTSGQYLYFIANGDLYRLQHDASTETVTTIENLMPTGRKVGRYGISELVYLTIEPKSGDLFVLDKTNDVFRYSDAAKWTMAHPAVQIPDQFPDPQFIAIQASGETVYALDADLSHVWQLEPGQGPPEKFWYDIRLQNARDMLLHDMGNGRPAFYFLLGDGSIARLEDGKYSLVYPAPLSSKHEPWPAHLFNAAANLAAVSAEARSVSVLDPISGELHWEATFALPNMQRLRTASQSGHLLYAMAGRNLYIADLTRKSNCRPASYDNTLYFQGVDLATLLRDFRPPFPGAIMPDRLRSYPGARRLYRHGIHEGVDLYGTDAPGVGMNSPVLAIADGTVARSDTEYEEMSPGTYEAAIARTVREHCTPPNLMDAFLGRQVYVQHGARIESHYSHLGSIAEGIVEGEAVQAGIPVGRVGVSGTSDGVYGTTGGAHLHLGIWIDGRYLGQGLSLYETMRLWQLIFNK